MTTADKTPTTETPAADVLTRFLTQGGGVVELHRHEWTVSFPATEDVNAHSVTKRGFNWRCLGCNAVGGGTYGLSPGYEEYEPRESRDHANQHATNCRALPPQGGQQ